MTQLFPNFPFDPIETPQSYAARLAWLHTEERCSLSFKTSASSPLI